MEDLIKSAAQQAAALVFNAGEAQRAAIIANAIRKVLMEERKNATQSS